MKLLHKETKVGFKWSTVHDGFSFHDCNYAIPSNFGLDFLAWISDAFMCCETRSDIASLQLDFSDAERYSIRKWCGTRQKNQLEINHTMRTTDFATEHHPAIAPATSTSFNQNLQKFQAENENFLDLN
jgi:hypothetical protein